MPELAEPGQEPAPPARPVEAVDLVGPERDEDAGGHRLVLGRTSAGCVLGTLGARLQGAPGCRAWATGPARAFPVGRPRRVSVGQLWSAAPALADRPGTRRRRRAREEDAAHGRWSRRRASGADLDGQPATVAVPSRNGCARGGSECVPIVTRRRHSAPCARPRGGPRSGTACAGRRTHRRAWPSAALAHRP